VNRALGILLVGLLAGCAAGRHGLAGRGDGPSRAASDGLDAWLLRNDAAGAAPRLEAALGRDPSDPWARLGQALLARRALDARAEADQLARLVAAAPDHPLTLVALRRLGELADGSPELARAVEAAVAPLSAGGRLAGLAAFRARVARISAAEALGDLDALARQRGENGAVTAWTLGGAFGALHAVDFERRFSPEEGVLPADAPAPFLGAARPTRALPAPDGLVTLEGEPADGDIYYLASEVTLARGGRYLAVLGSSASLRVWLDGAPLAERRASTGPTATQLARPVTLAAGRHVLLAKVARGGARPGLVVNLVRQDGAPSDLTARPLPPGPVPPCLAGPFPAGAGVAADLSRALEPGGQALSRLLAGRDAQSTDLESAKALLEEGLARHPGSAALRAARGAAHAGDPTLDEQIGRGRAETALRTALSLDAGDGETRLTLADLLRRSDRSSDAEALLAVLPEPLAQRPQALAVRARVALDRSLPEQAEALAEAARAGDGSCEALRLLAEQAARRDAVQREEELVRALAAGCRGGREKLVRLLEQRGDAAGVLAALAPVLRTRPAAIGPALQRAGALASLGDHAAAARSLGPPLELWPRAVALLKAAADQAELAGQAGQARALRERALRVDGSDLGLRRALALQDGTETLAEVALDGEAALRAYLADPPREAAGSALVLDAAAVEIHPGGAVTERVHQVIRVLGQEAVDQYGELGAPAGAQLLTLRTIKADGRILEPEGGEGKGSSSLSGLEPGDFVELEFLRSSRGHHARLGVAADPFYFETPGASMFRSTYLVRAPRGLGLEVDAHGMPAPPVAQEGPFEVVRAERIRVPPLVPEPAAPPAPELLPFLQVGAGEGRPAVQLALADAAADRTAPTAELRALAAEVRTAAGAGADAAALARAAHDRVRQLVVGQGGSLAEDASVVLSRGRGSRLVLLKALLDALGVPARFALVRPAAGDRTDYRFPGPSLWSGQLLRVTLPGQTLWLDPSVRQMAFGVVPDHLLDAEALILPAPGEAAEVARTPTASGQPEGRELELHVTLRADGSAEVAGLDRYQGALGAFSKAGFERLDATARRQAVEQMLARAFRGLVVTSLAVEGEQDPEAPLAIRWTGTVAGLARAADGGLELDAPLLQLRLGARYVQLASRRTPLLLATRERTVLRLTVTPPPGLQPAPPAAQRLESPFGTFTRSERLEAGTFWREDRLDLRSGRIAPEAYQAFAEFCGAVDALEARPVPFRP
jgi:hypothetical protein